MFDSAREASFAMPDGLPELIETLEQTWPGHLAEIRASGVPTNETPEEPAGDPAAGEPDPAGEPAAEPAATAPEPSFDPLELEYLRETVARQESILATLAERFNGDPAAAAAAPAAQGFEELYDEFGNVRPDALIGLMRDAAKSAVEPIQQQIAQARTEAEQAQRQGHYGELVEDMLADNVARNGDLSEEAISLLEARAMQLLPGLNQKYGANPDGTARPGVLERAIEQAASEVRGLLSAHGSETSEQERNRLASLAAAGGEPGPAGTGGVVAPVIKIGERSVDRFAGAGR